MWFFHEEKSTERERIRLRLPCFRFRLSRALALPNSFAGHLFAREQ
jgi:hypothetical protein